MNQAVEKYDGALTVADMKQQVNLIQHVMKEVMKKGEHYGTIPGCGDKPTLLKPGAEKLSMTFRMAPNYQIIKSDLPGGHREYQVVCSLSHITSGDVLGQGLGVCTTMESKYRFRKAARECPSCGQESIIKGRAEYGGGWLCYKAKGGCNEKWNDGAKEIEDQKTGSVEYENPADYYNTVIKMAKKRAHVDAVLTATAASDIFTQDIEDIVEVKQAPEPESGQKKTGTATKTTPPSQDDVPPIAHDKKIPASKATAFRKEAGRLKLDGMQVKSMIKAQGFNTADDISVEKYDELFNALGFMADEAKEGVE